MNVLERKLELRQTSGQSYTGAARYDTSARWTPQGTQNITRHWCGFTSCYLLLLSTFISTY